MPIFIVGNKIDKENERQVPNKDAKDFSLSRRTKYFTECSAKTGYNVNDIFHEVVKYLYSACKELGKNKIPSNNKLKINMDNNITDDQKKKKKCC